MAAYSNRYCFLNWNWPIFNVVWFLHYINFFVIEPHLKLLEYLYISLGIYLNILSVCLTEEYFLVKSSSVYSVWKFFFYLSTNRTESISYFVIGRNWFCRTTTSNWQVFQLYGKKSSKRSLLTQLFGMKLKKFIEWTFWWSSIVPSQNGILLFVETRISFAFFFCLTSSLQKSK